MVCGVVGEAKGRERGKRKGNRKGRGICGPEEAVVVNPLIFVRESISSVHGGSGAFPYVAAVVLEMRVPESPVMLHEVLFGEVDFQSGAFGNHHLHRGSIGKDVTGAAVPLPLDAALTVL